MIWEIKWHEIPKQILSAILGALGLCIFIAFLCLVFCWFIVTVIGWSFVYIFCGPVNRKRYENFMNGQLRPY